MEYIERSRVNEVKNNNFKIKNISNKYNAIKSTCRIECSGNVGSGFFIKLKKDNKPFYCLMTCEHVINKKMIASKETINVQYDCKNKSIDIKLESRFIKCYKYLGIDAIVIEILEKDGIKEEFFLMPNYDYKKGYDQFKYKSIVIIQYPGGNDLSESEGIITEINQYTNGFTHLSSTESGSSGGLIVLSENSEVLGIHKQGNVEKSENYGNFIGPLIDSLMNNYLYEKKQIGEKIIECETNRSNNKCLGRLKYKREYIYRRIKK